MIHKISPQNNHKSQKKVQFDSARVAFQVEYDIPDDRSLRHRIPVWTEHWKKSKSGLLLQLLRAVSFCQWIRLLVLFLCVSLLFLQIFQTIELFLKRETLVTADYSLGSDFPSLSLCVPFAPLFCNQSCPVQRFFNQSLSVFHRCKHVSQEDRTRVCAPPLTWIHRSKKCFTYETADEDRAVRVELLLQSETEEEVQLFVHQKRVLPFDEKSFPAIALKREKDIQISFFKTTVVQHHDCRDDASDCLSRCLFRPCAHLCRSRSAPIRADLVSSSDLFCRDTSNCDHSSQCSAECPEDCIRSSFHLSLSEEVSRVESESNVSLRRQLTPDLTLRHIPRITCLELTARVGGLTAFWAALFWLFSRTLLLLSLTSEVFEIYFK